jgi:HSP20 family protein
MNRWDPVTEVFDEDDAVFVRVDLTGIEPEDVHIDATERLLIVLGSRGTPSGMFTHSFRLPETADGGAAIAIMNEGILTVRIPKRCAPRSDTFAA